MTPASSLPPCGHQCLRCRRVSQYPTGGKPDGTGGPKAQTDNLCPICRWETSPPDEEPDGNRPKGASAQLDLLGSSREARPKRSVALGSGHVFSTSAESGIHVTD